MKKLFPLFCIALLLIWILICLLSDFKNSTDTIELNQIMPPELGEEIAIIETNLGEMKLRLFPEVAPKAVENFKTLSMESFYDGIKFERVAYDFLIQIGEHPDYKSGKSIYENFFEDEYHEDYRHFSGAVGLAKEGDNQNNSNFYIICNNGIEEAYLDAMRDLYDMGYPKHIVDAYEILGGIPRLDHRYTIFAQVFDGMDILNEINRTEVNTIDMPIEPVIINTIRIVPYQ